MKINGKNRWIFKLEHDTFYNQSVIQGVSFENEWLKISPNGEIKIKASKDKAFTWDGCTPKWSILDIVVGTPDGVVYTKTGLRKTQRGSLLHDVMYQFAPRNLVTREQADKLFYLELQKTDFKLAWLYWKVVSIFGRPYWLNRYRG